MAGGGVAVLWRSAAAEGGQTVKLKKVRLVSNARKRMDGLVDTI